MKHSLILFDGVCNLCNGAVNFVYKRDKKDQFRYKSLQSDLAEEILAEHNYKGDMDSFVLLHEGKLYSKSSAALMVGKLLGFPYSLAFVFMIVPKFIRNTVYDFIASNRYKWFGKRDESCEYDPEFSKKTQWKK